MHELRYFQEIHALSEDIDVLWLLKCQAVLNDEFQDLSALKIFFEGREEWLFDFLPTKREASEFIAEASLPTFEVAKINNKIKYRGRKK